MMLRAPEDSGRRTVLSLPGAVRGAPVAAGDRAAAAHAGRGLPELAAVSAGAGWMPPSQIWIRAAPELAHCTWGARKPVHIRHPLSHGLPFLSRLAGHAAKSSCRATTTCRACRTARSALPSVSRCRRGTKTRAISHAWRAERPPPVALLPGRVHGLGARAAARRFCPELRTHADAAA